MCVLTNVTVVMHGVKYGFHLKRAIRTGAQFELRSSRDARKYILWRRFFAGGSSWTLYENYGSVACKSRPRRTGKSSIYAKLLVFFFVFYCELLNRSRTYAGKVEESKKPVSFASIKFKNKNDIYWCERRRNWIRWNRKTLNYLVTGIGAIVSYKRRLIQCGVNNRFIRKEIRFNFDQRKLIVSSIITTESVYRTVRFYTSRSRIERKKPKRN